MDCVRWLVCVGSSGDGASESTSAEVHGAAVVARSASAPLWGDDADAIGSLVLDFTIVGTLVRLMVGRRVGATKADVDERRIQLVRSRWP